MILLNRGLATVLSCLAWCLGPKHRGPRAFPKTRDSRYDPETRIMFPEAAQTKRTRKLHRAQGQGLPFFVFSRLSIPSNLNFSGFPAPSPTVSSTHGVRVEGCSWLASGPLRDCPFHPIPFPFDIFRKQSASAVKTFENLLSPFFPRSCIASPPYGF